MTSTPMTAEVRRRILVGPVSLSVAEYGVTGERVVLLHGIGSRGVSWWPVIDDFATEFRLIVPDLRGHGDSDKPRTGYLIGDYVADLDGLLNALDLERPLIVGHSLGGSIAMTWAVDHPGRAAGIVLEDVPFRRRADGRSMFDAWLALARMSVDEAVGQYRRRYPHWTDEDCRRRAKSITATSPAVFTEMRDRTEADDTADVIAGMAGVQSPLLLVRGDLDTGSMVEPDDAERLVATMPNARQVRIPGGSHALHRDQTSAFMDAVVPFLRSPGH